MSREARKEFEASQVINRLKSASAHLAEIDRMMQKSLIPKSHRRMLLVIRERTGRLERNLLEWRRPELRAERKRKER